jgi:diguanylate cyclase (GGDEF)-like protein
VRKRRNSSKLKKSRLAAQNKKLLKKLKEASFKDPLTKLPTYQYFTERLEIGLRNAKKYMIPLSLILVDIDYFKSINNTYGHRIGNNLLRCFARYLKRFVRVSDILTRYVGAGFVLLLPNTPKPRALALGQRLCENIQKNPFRVREIEIKLKTSLGIICYPDDNINSVAGLIDALDKAVYRAKELGGNKVCSYEAITKKEKTLITKTEEVEGLKVNLKKAGKKLDQALLESIYAFAKAIEARDHYTGEHAEKMVSIVRNISKELGLSQDKMTSLEQAAVLHDLGKIGIDDKILRKKAKLSKKEYDQIKKHPLIGAEIIRSIHFLKEVVPFILYHHERFDGKGYVAGLKGNDIPLGARILAIADVYQALISDRPYRKAYSQKKALAIIKEGAGKQFDPDVVKALLKTVKKYIPKK